MFRARHHSPSGRTTEDNTFPPPPTSLRSLARLLHPLRTVRSRRTRTTRAATDLKSPVVASADPACSRPAKKHHSLFHLASNEPLKLKGLSLHAPHLVTVQDNALTPLPASNTVSAHSPPPGYVVAGDVANIFDAGIAGRLYKLIPTGEKDSAGVREMLDVIGDVPLSQLFPGAPAEVVLSGVRFLYGAVEKGSHGLYLQASISLSQFAPCDGEVRVRAFLGEERNWRKALAAGRVEIEGSARVDRRAEMGLKVVKVGVRVVVQKKSVGPLRRMRWGAEVEVRGSVDVVMPGLAVPVVLGWGLRKEEAGRWVWRVGQEAVEGVVGMKGLRLEDLEMVCILPKGAKIVGGKMEMKATLAFQGAKLQLSGAYENGDFFLEASLPAVTVNDIINLYTSMTGRKVESPAHSAELKDMRFRIDNTGLAFSGSVTVNGHHSAQGQILVKRDGIMITGSLENLCFHEITVESAALDIFIGRKIKNETSRESGFSVVGKVTFHSLELDVAVYTTFAHDGGAEYTVYGELQGTGMKLNRLAPDVEGTWLDIELRQIAFIVSNSDAPSGSYNTFGYPVAKGVQFCAMIDRIELIDHIARTKVDGLVLRAIWHGGKNFAFEAVLPTPVGIHLTKTITSGPITVGIVPAKIPELVITASLNVIPPGQKHPLVFTFGLKANLLGAKGFGEMTNYWVNPFGISEAIKVGPNLALEVGIIYAVLAATGTPSSIGLSGGMAIGDVEAQCAMVISENPADQLLKASLTELSIVDLTKFANEVTGTEMPIPPEDLMAFRDVLIYLSTGTSVGTTQYPAGASMRGEMELFGKETKLDCTIGAVTKIDARFESLQLGPLALTGATPGTGPTTVIELGRQKQHILIDGAVKLFDFEASVHGIFDILPVPSMCFSIDLSFGDALRMSLTAEVVGLIDWKNLHGADFMIHAVLEQDIVAYLIAQLTRFLEAIVRFFNHGLEAAHDFIDAAEDAFNDSVAAVADAFEDAKAKWEEKEHRVKRRLHEVSEDFEDGIRALQEEIFGVESAAESAINHATQELQTAKITNASAVRTAEIAVSSKRAQSEKDVKSKLVEIRGVKEAAKAGFGAIDAHVLEAEARVRETRSYANHCETLYASSLDLLARAHFYRKLDLHIKCTQMRETRDAANASLAAAESAFSAAREQAAHPTLAELKERKLTLKEKLRETRRIDTNILTAAESELAAQRAAESAVLAYHEAKIVKEKMTLEPALREKARALAEMKELKTPMLEKLKEEAACLHESEEFCALQHAQRQLSNLKSHKLDSAVAKKVVGDITANLPVIKKPLRKLNRAMPGFDQAAETTTTILNGVENVVNEVEDVRSGVTEIFNVHRVELTGSLRALVERGVPLKARVQGVVVGREFDVVVDYGLRDLAGLVEGCWEKVWEVVKDVFEAEEDSENESEES